MSKTPGDHVGGGGWPLQHLEEARPLEGRHVRWAYRVESVDPVTDRVIAAGHSPPEDPDLMSVEPERTAGDVFGGFLVRKEDGKRPFPLWSFALPAVTTEASRDLRDRGGKPRTTPRTTGTRVRQLPTPAGNGSQIGPGDAAQRVKIRPIGDEAFNPDDRFKEIDCALSPDQAPLPKGFPGIVLTAIDENVQKELFLPSGTAPLIAVDFAGDPTLATLVSDLTPGDEIDTDRQARLHTLMRVVRLGAACAGLSTSNALAIQLKAASQDGFSGHGLVIDGASVFPVGDDEEEDPRQTNPDNPPQDALDDTQTRARHEAVGDQLANDPDQGAGPGPTRTRERSGSSTRPRHGQLPPGLGNTNVLAALTSKLSGIVEVGLADDQHRLGTTLDGEPINASHLPTSVLFLGAQGDAPLHFESTPYTNPPGVPFTLQAHIRLNPEASHNWVCGDGAGRFDLEADSAYYIPQPPRLPPPKKPPEIELVIQPHGVPVAAGNPLQNGIGPPPQSADRPKWLIELERRLGLRTGSIGVSGGRRGQVTLPPDVYKRAVDEGHVDVAGALLGGEPTFKPTSSDEPITGRGLYPTFVQCIRAAGGVLFRAFATGDGAPNVTGGDDDLEQITEELKKKMDKNPDVGWIAAMAKGGNNGVVNEQDGQNWKYEFLGGPFNDSRAAGALVFGPAGVRLKEVLEKTAKIEGEPLRVVLPGSTTSLDFADPHTDPKDPSATAGTGAVRMQQTVVGLEFVNLDASTGVVASVPRMLFGEAGLLVTGNAQVTGKLTVDGSIDPTDLQLTDLNGALSSIPGGAAGMEFDATVDALRPLWTDPAGVRRALAFLADTGGASNVPTGGMMPFGGSVIPAGFLLCDGTAVSRATFAALFAVIATAYGVGDGSTTFNVPNFTGRSPMGVNAAGSGQIPTARGQALGTSTQTLTAAQLAVHSHGVTDPGHGHGVTDPGHGHGITDPTHNHTIPQVQRVDPGAGTATLYVLAGAGPGASTFQAATGVSVNSATTGATVNSATTGISTNNAGSGTGHNNVPPVLGVDYIIKT